MKKIFFYLILGGFLSGCYLEKPIDLPTQIVDDELVIHALLSPQQGIRAYLGRTLSPADPQGAAIVDGIQADVFQQGTYWTSLVQVDTSLYQLPEGFTVSANMQYSLRVSAPGFPTATTESISMIETVPLESVNYDTLYHTVTFSFQDPAPIGNGYAWGRALWENGEILRGSTRPGSINPTQAVNDQEWNGDLVEVELRTDFFEIDSLQLQFWHLSPSLYQYCSDLAQAQITNGDPLLNPPLIQGNITGGRGFFEAVSVESHLFR